MHLDLDSRVSRHGAYLEMLVIGRKAVNTATLTLQADNCNLVLSLPPLK